MHRGRSEARLGAGRGQQRKTNDAGDAGEYERAAPTARDGGQHTGLFHRDSTDEMTNGRDTKESRVHCAGCARRAGMSLQPRSNRMTILLVFASKCVSRRSCARSAAGASRRARSFHSVNLPPDETTHQNALAPVRATVARERVAAAPGIVPSRSVSDLVDRRQQLGGNLALAGQRLRLPQRVEPRPRAVRARGTGAVAAVRNRNRARPTARRGRSPPWLPFLPSPQQQRRMRLRNRDDFRRHAAPIGARRRVVKPASRRVVHRRARPPIPPSRSHRRRRPASPRRLPALRVCDRAGLPLLRSRPSASSARWRSSTTAARSPSAPDARPLRERGACRRFASPSASPRTASCASSERSARGQHAIAGRRMPFACSSAASASR